MVPQTQQSKTPCGKRNVHFGTLLGSEEAEGEKYKENKTDTTISYRARIFLVW